MILINDILASDASARLHLFQLCEYKFNFFPSQANNIYKILVTNNCKLGQYISNPKIKPCDPFQNLISRV